MPIFVTGGSGFIGQSVIRELHRRSHVVRALARSGDAERKVRAAGAEPVRGELRDLDALREGAANADAVVFLAQEMSAENASVTERAITTLIDALPPGRAFIYTSGVWVYGSRGDAVIAEDAPLAPLDLVGWRPAIEELVLSQQGRLRPLVIRPGIVYGDGGGIPGMMVEQARTGTLQVVGDGANRWPCVRHDALAELYALAIEHRTASGVYNAGLGAAIPYVEIARAASRAAGGDGTVGHLSLDEARAAMGGFADALASDLQIDSGKAARELGWEPHRPTLLEELSNTTVV
ncbi:MAG TPA: NAD-dependent epimerase/dehydratase family protein [Candidatus Elarobacter sp.]